MIRNLLIGGLTLIVASCSAPDGGVIVSNESDAHKRLYLGVFGENHRIEGAFRLNNRGGEVATYPFPLMYDTEIRMNISNNNDPLKLGCKISIFNYDKQEVFSRDITQEENQFTLWVVNPYDPNRDDPVKFLPRINPLNVREGIYMLQVEMPLTKKERDKIKIKNREPRSVEIFYSITSRLWAETDFYHKFMNERFDK